MSTVHAQVSIPRQSPRRGTPPPRRDLRVVPPRRARPARAPFVVLVCALLAGGLLTLLLLNTVLAQDSFVLHSLQTRSAQLSDQEQSLQQEVALAGAPDQLAARAKALGMVPSENPVFLNPATGKVLGVPKAAGAQGVPKAAGAQGVPKAAGAQRAATAAAGGAQPQVGTKVGGVHR
jgi:hypothetical protein